MLCAKYKLQAERTFETPCRACSQLSAGQGLRCGILGSKKREQHGVDLRIRLTDLELSS